MRAYNRNLKNNILLRQAMQDKHIVQWQLAEILGCSEITISRMFRKEMPIEKQNEIINRINESSGG